MTPSTDDRDHEEEGSEPVLNRQTSELLQLARREGPAPDLEARLLDSLAYRARLGGAEPPPASSRKLIYLATGLAAAAALTLWFLRAPEEQVGGLDHEKVEIGAEPVVAGAASSGTNGVGVGSTTNNVGATSSEAPKQEPPKPVLVDPCAASVVASGATPLVDDFEDGDDAVLPNEQREGLWRWVRDTDRAGTAPALLPVPRPKRKKN